MAMLTNGVVSGLLTLIADNNMPCYQESLEEFVGGDDETKKRQCASLQQIMRGLWNGNGKIQLSEKDGIKILEAITKKLREFLKEGELKKFNLVVFNEMVNWADAGYHQSLAFDAKAKARELKIEIGPTIGYAI